jgi:hypothetical protein
VIPRCRAAHLVLGSILLFAFACGSDGDGSPLAIKLRDSSVEGGDPAFVTLELADRGDAATLQVSPGIVLRREDRDLHVLLPRTPDLESYPSVNAPGATLPPIYLQPGTEYRVDVPDLEPGFHQLCVNYSINQATGRACAELALG